MRPPEHKLWIDGDYGGFRQYNCSCGWHTRWRSVTKQDWLQEQFRRHLARMGLSG